MLLRLEKLAIIILLTMTSTYVDAAKRRSRIDLPAVKQAAFLLDNIKTPTTTPAAKIDSIKSTLEYKVDKDVAGENSDEDMEYDECDVDNVSFELVTG